MLNWCTFFSAFVFKAVQKIFFWIAGFIFCQQNLFAHIENSSSILKYTENKGQWEDQILYKAKLGGGSVFLEKNAFTFVCYDNDIASKIHPHNHDEKRRIHSDAIKLHALKFSFVNTSAGIMVKAAGMQEHYYNYFTGNDPSRWKSAVRDYKEVYYENVYPGIDYKIYSDYSNFKYDIVVKPPADASLIKFKLEGATYKLEQEGLSIITSVGKLLFKNPYAYQVINGKRKKILCEYILSDNILSYRIGNYDKSLELIIDPTLIFASFSGSTEDNWGMTATYDNLGNAYAGGISFGVGYPVTTGAYQSTYAGGGSGGDPNIVCDISVSKYNSTGSAFIYSTYLGGNDNEIPQSMIVNNNNELLILGRTYSSNFPVTSSAFDNSKNSGCDMVISKLNSTGTQLMASTFIGGSGDDGINVSPMESIRSGLKYNYSDDARGEINIDNQDNVYVASCTMSTNFPVTSGAYQTTFSGGGQDACVFKLNSNLSNLIYSTYLGGNQDDAAYSLIVDDDYSVYVAGGTYSNNYFNTGTSIFANTGSGTDIDGFITHLNTNGSAILESKYIGTGSDDQCYFVQQDRNDNIYVFGQSQGSIGVSSGVYNNPNSGQFIIKMPSDLSGVLFKTTLGSGRGTPDISPSAFLVDNCDNIYISGWGGDLFGYNVATSSTTGMPVSSGAFQTSTDGADFYFMVLDRDAQNLVYATYFGGSMSQEHVDGGTSRFDKSGVIYQSVCGGCGGLSDMPTTGGVVSTTNNANNCNNALIKFKFDFTNTVAAYIPNVIPSAGCAPLYIQFNNNSLNGSSYTWDFGDGTSDTAASPSHLYTVPGNYQIMLIATNMASCNIRDTAYGTITVVPPVEINPINDTSYCDGSSVQLQASGQNVTSYSWSPQAGLSNPNISNPMVFINIDTTYTVTVSNGLCSASDDVHVHVIPIVTADISNISPSSGCAPFTVNFNNQSNNANSYVWDFGDGGVSAITNAIYTYNTPGVYIVTLTATNNTSCNINDDDTTTITVLAPPQIQAPNDTIVCTGSTVQLNAIASGATTYIWSPSTGLNNSNIQNPTTQVNNTISYQVTADNGVCSATDSVQISVLPVVTATISGNIAGCAPLNVIFSNNSQNANNYIWNFGDNTMSVNATPQHDYLQAGTYTAILSAYNSASCNGLDTASLIINVYPPVILNPMSDGEVCEGNSLQLTTSMGYNYTWTPSLYLNSNVIYNPVCSPLDSITYVVVASNANCSASDTIHVTLNKNITQIISSSSSIYFCEGDTVTLSTTQPYSTYSWSGGSNNASITTVNEGLYQVETIDANGCEGMDTITLIAHANFSSFSSGDELICRGSKTTLAASGGTIYQWTPSSGLSSIIDSSVIASPQNTTQYTVTISDGICSKKDTIIVQVVDIPTLQLSEDAEINWGEEMQLLATTDQQSCIWSPEDYLSCVNCFDPKSLPDSDIVYYASVTNSYGCTVTDSVRIKVNQEPSIYIPNCFTPNDNDLNELFRPVCYHIKEIDAYIFDRWGNEIYHWTDLEGGWNGRVKNADPKQDVYVYLIYARSVFDDKKICLNGTVTVLK